MLMSVRDRLAREFVKLHQMQLDSMDAATFLGMTPAEWREYDARQFCIRVLTQQLCQLLLLDRTV
jgi:hypothetical protein